MKRSQLGLVVLIVAAFTLVVYFDLTSFLTLESIQTSREFLLGYSKSNPVKTVLLYFVFYIGVTALSLPGAAVMSLAGGMLFGLILGTVVISFASTIGASLAFLVSRFLLRDLIQSRYAEKLKTINDGMSREGKFYLFSLRLIPAFPFFLINILMGLTNIRLREFFLVSQIGMLPGTIVYVNAGTQLGHINSVSEILSLPIMISFALLGLFPLLAKRLLVLVRGKYLT